MPKRRERPPTASTRCTTRCTGRTCWNGPTSAVVPTTARRGSISRRSRTSRRMGWSDGWTNWRRNWKRRRTAPNRCDACTFLNRMESNARWGSVRFGIAWRRWPWFWTWSGAIRVPSQPQRVGCRQARPRAGQHGAYGSRRCRFIELLRRNPPRRTPQVALPPDQRSAPAGADQEMAGGAGRGDRQAGSASPDDAQQGRGPGQPAGVTSVPVASEHLYALFCPRLEDPGTRAAVESHDRQLRGRSRDLLSGHGRGGDVRDAAHDVQAEVDGQRGQDAAASDSRGDVRLSGLYDRPVLLAADGTVLYRDTPVGEEDRAPSGRDPRDHRPPLVVDGSRGPSGATEPAAAGVVELLLPRPREPGVPCPRPALLQSASPVALRQAQGEDPGDITVPRSVPVRRVGADPPERTDEELPVGESMSSCPRAGCGKTACPVR